jgi:hypothetical protein
MMEVPEAMTHSSWQLTTRRYFIIIIIIIIMYLL